jgi:hypothetical protein
LGVLVGGAVTLPLGYALQELEKLAPELLGESTFAAAAVEEKPEDLAGLFIEAVEADLEGFRKEERTKSRRWFRSN